MMNQENLIVTCPGCGAKNRIPENRLSEGPVCGRCKTPLAASTRAPYPVNVSDNNFSDEVLSFAGLVLVDFWAPWCGPCRMISPILEDLAKEYCGRLKVAKLNVDENPKTASRYQVQGIPTMLVFNKGVQVERLVGALPREEIKRQLQRFL